MLSIHQISKKFTHHQALSSVSLEVSKGSIYGLIGHNGAGKTTLIRIITQILKPDRGEVRINGELLHPKHRYLIGYLPEERGLYKKMTVFDYLLFIAHLHEMETSVAKSKIDFWISKFDLQKFAKKEINGLSKGMQQKVQFIATVFFEPELLILDEPFSGFDPSNVELLKNEILELNKKGVTIIFSTHQMEAVEELCKEVTMINQSKVVLSGNLQEIKKEYKTGEIYIKTSTKLSLPTVWECSVYKEGYKVVLKKEQSKSELLANINLEELLVFEELESSLKEIFLAKVREQ